MSGDARDLTTALRRYAVIGDVAARAEADETGGWKTNYPDLLMAAADEIERLRVDGVRCCKGCPDCLGIGAHSQIEALLGEIAQLRVELEEARESARVADAQGYMRGRADERRAGC